MSDRFRAFPNTPLALLRALVLALAVASLAGAALAQRGPRAEPSAPPQSGAPAKPAETQSPAASQRLPAAATTDHAIELSGRTLNFKATAGAIPLNDGDGKLQAEVAYIAYVVDGDAQRPVTFVFNGGPGAASAYLNIGAMGPWRLPLDHAAPSSPVALQPNGETWLDFTDLVFIDPPGTGYSRIAGGDDVRRRLWSVEGDADALAVVIRKWTEQAGRQKSAKFIVGESYGGFRAPKIARKLQGGEGVGIRGLVLVSPVIDFASFGTRRHAPMSWVAHLPSMAAAALEAKGAFDKKFDRETLREVERYASGDYLLDLLKGERDKSAVERISPRVAAFTGLDLELVRRLAGRVDNATFQRESYRGRGLVGSAYDPNITALDPYPTSPTSHFPDPVLDGLRAPLTTAMTDLYQHVLNWRVEQPYHLLQGDISGRWDWGRGRTGPEVVDDLRNVLASDRQSRLLIAHGASDLVTPYFANQLLLDQLPAYGSAERVKLSVYGGGHMFYTRDASRRSLREDAEVLYRAALKPADLAE